MDVSELIPLVVEFLATIESFVGTLCFDRSAECFPSRTIMISKWYGEELVIRVGVF